jgi:hypothetical protein
VLGQCAYRGWGAAPTGRTRPIATVLVGDREAATPMI